MSDPIRSDCHTTYRATRSSGNRLLKNIRLIVWHSTETAPNTAQSVARYFASNAAKGSAHLVLDDLTCYRTLANNKVPWAAPGANENGFHIEQCGHAAWSTEEWEKHLPMLHRTAFKTAFHCRKFKIQPVFLPAFKVKAGAQGITTHHEVTKAFPKLGSHTDPGAGFPIELVMSMTKHYFYAMV